MPRNPRTVNVDDLRRILGDEAAAKVLTTLNPPPPTIRVKDSELATAIDLFRDPLQESKMWREVIDVVRRYFIDKPVSRHNFLKWAEEMSASEPDSATSVFAVPANPPKERRERQKITDPEVLEKRREALAKARAVLAEHRAAAAQ